MRKALELAKSELEAQVQARTASLRDTNERLQLQIEERQDVEEQLRQSRKMDAIGRLAGGMAHDMNNVLAAILAYAELLLEDMDPNDKVREDIAAIADSALRGSDLTSQLLAFARRKPLVATEMSLHAIVGDTQRLLERTLQKRVEVRIELNAERHWLAGDPSQLSNAIMNLCLNAVDAMGASGKLVLRTEDS